MEPFTFFNDRYQEEINLSDARIPSACCLSTVGLDGFPNARFVSLKEVRDEKFIVTGPLNSRKGREIKNCDRVALTFWWPHTEVQVRVQGRATTIPVELAKKYFSERDLDSQIVSVICEQGEVLKDMRELNELFENEKQRNAGSEIKMPLSWGGFSIAPVRIEFLVFKASRLHERKLFEPSQNNWTLKLIQP